MSKVNSSQVSHQDVVILGAGVFGLLLAHQLIGRMDNGRHIWLVEHRGSYATDKTFGFFCARDQVPLSIQPIIEHSFDSWCISTAENAETMQAENMAYHVVSSSCLYAYCNKRIESAAQVTRCLDTDADQFLQDMPIHYGWPLVIDTRPSLTSNFQVNQRFVGGEWVSKQPHGIEQPTLMGNMRVVAGLFLFDYVIPLDAYRLLVQVTAFYPQTARMVSTSPVNAELGELDKALNKLDDLLRQELHKDIEQSTQLNSMLLVREESGSIPMGLLAEPFKSDANPRHFCLASRQVTPFSGYGFLNAVTLSGDFSRAIAANPHLDGSNLEALLRGSLAHCQFPFSAMSAVFLDLVERHQTRLPEVFWRLGTKASADHFAQFLGSPTKRSATAMIAQAPKRLFARVALNRLLVARAIRNTDVKSSKQPGLLG